MSVKVAFLLPSLEPSGGTGVVVGHARRLAAREGFEPEIVLTSAPAEASQDIGVPVCPLREARTKRYAVAVATWWETATELWELDAGRRVLFLQSIESRFYEESELLERLGADSVLALGVEFVAVAGWMRELLQQLRPEAQVRVVPNGIDKQLFGPLRRSARGGPLRVLIEGQPSLWFKGVHEAVAAARAMNEPAHVTVAALEPGAAGTLGADEVAEGLDADGMARLYASSDVLVKLSRVEGLGLPALEAMHAGVPCVVTPYTGHEEYVDHGRNGIVVAYDDQPGVTRWLDLLARDRSLLERLSQGALAGAAEWPDVEESTDGFAAVLTDIFAGADLAPEADARLLMRVLLRHRELGRERVRELGSAEGAHRLVDERDLLIDELNEMIEELNFSRDECAEMLAEARAEVRRLRGTLPVRAALAARRLKPGGRS